jgi:hypothetical protein
MWYDSQPATGQRTVIAPLVPSGPAVYSNRIYDGVAMDQWGAAAILCNLLINQTLYEVPNETNLASPTS